MSNWDNLDKFIEMDSIPIKKSAISKIAINPEEENGLFTEENNDSDTEDGMSTSTSSKINIESESEDEGAGDIVITNDFTVGDVNLVEVLNRFNSKYDNIISEFADVEIFLISLDGLLIELTAHSYLNWTLGGQTIIIAKQIEILLKQLSNLGGKFKLIWFTDLSAIYVKDTILNFLRSFVAAYLLQSQWAADVDHFANPSDSLWLSYLHELMPSFLLIGVDDVSENVVADTALGFKQLLASIALQALASTIPVVYLNGLVVNLCSVYSHRVEPHMVDFKGWTDYLIQLWVEKKDEVHRNINLSSCKSVSQLWAQIIGDNKKSGGLPKESDALTSAVLISSLICERRGTERRYFEENKASKRGIDFIKFRRTLLNSCSSFLDTLDIKRHPLSFSLIDLWDGPFIAGIYDAINSGVKVLPYRLQQEFAHLHKKACLELSLEVDIDDALFDSAIKEENSKKPALLPINSALLNLYAPEMLSAFPNYSQEMESSTFKQFLMRVKWRLDAIEEPYTKPEERIDNEYRMKNKNKNKQKLSKWYEFFAESLEGRGSSLLVDFSRTPRGFASKFTDQTDKKKEKQQWQPKGKGNGPKGKGAVKSKKELILEANRNKKNEKLAEDEKQMVRFAVQQGKNAMFILENLMNKLELGSSRAMCIYQQMLRMSEDFSSLEGKDLLEKRRIRAVPIINKLKDLFTLYWQHLDDKQKEYVTDLWVSLGFERSKKSTAFSESRLTLNMNMIYYQLAYGGEIIDIRSDPQKDDRVTGFQPDAWQRRMLDAVDKNHSAVIIAPTSAGKTFVSYYCIERVLRQSDEDMVVYVSPSKALLNQVCGSVYARFHNKTLTGGKTLFGTLLLEHFENPMNCQVLVTIPECLENLLLSTNPVVQAMIDKIKYVIFDEVHCISASPDAHIWEHLLLLIRCPFLALSATISNATVLHQWLQSAEKSKNICAPLNEVELITYGERYSELELAVQRINPTIDTAVPDGTAVNSMVQHFMPYGVYKPVKLSMFGIPDDQQLTARQILDLYHALAEVDPVVKEEFEPCSFFNYKLGGEKIWLTREDIRRLEVALKNRFLEWLGINPERANKVLQQIGKNVEQELDFRSRPFDQRAAAMKSIAPLVLELRDKELLPAICFNEDRRMCEKLAQQLFDYLEMQQKEFEASAEYKKYEIKDEEKIAKMMKRKRDAAATKEKKKSKAVDKFERAETEELEHKEQVVDDYDPLAAMRLRLDMVLERFKLHGRQRDVDLYQKVTARLTKDRISGRETTKLLFKLFERGIGFHHPGLNSKERGAVEILFRSGHLAILFSTSTLALGINMPCKTVLFGVDDANLTPLQFRQMSGRAGRRGFDHSGSVIFMSIPTAKIRRLLTASLSTLRGNLPFTTSYILRLFGYIHQEDSMMSKLRSGNQKFSPFELRLQTVLSFLTNSFILYTRAELSSTVQKQLRLYTLFAVQVLRSLDLLNENGELSGLASLVCHLSGNEPGNLLFAHLLQNGVFHNLCRDNTVSREEMKSQLVLIFAHLFTNLRLPLNWNPDDKNSYPSAGESEVFLKPLPESCTRLIKQYANRVEILYREFMRLNDPNKRLQGDVFSLTGYTDSSVSMFSSSIVHPFHDCLLFDESFIPARCPCPVDHRGRKVYLNAYAVDFWRLESKKTLERDNGISENRVWSLIHNFSATLLKIKDALLAIGRSKDPFVELMVELANEYDKKFCVAFSMKQKNRVSIEAVE
ncbi:DEAD/DEAH box helicase family protein [Brugia malayi]|uniref:DEAD/DEAH box helicase family protein n=1 Tax=Brugia malayi TaxID=6279 RepID=A0A4E9F545_BRUMA|nr:DEAD/DEAH box helicase family protein [Brugia malayi]VIO90324.1 DEAD/DEAH box helicase family protein [Brugia malayi]